MSRLLLAVLFSVIGAGYGCSSNGEADLGATSWTLASPSGALIIDLALLDLGGEADFPAGERLYYRIAAGTVEVLQWSPLGIATDAVDFTGSLQFRHRSARRIDESYHLPVGKRRARRARANEMTLRFANRAGDEIEIDFRAADDGAAFRYRILGDGTAIALGEASGFRLAAGADAWLVGYLNPHPFAPAYESLYVKVPAGTTSSDRGWGYAALFRPPGSDVFALLAEADLDREYAGTHLSQPIETLYRVAYPSEGEGRFEGNVLPRSELPWTTPWRVVIAGDLATVFASTLVEDLSRPTAEVFGGDVDWIQPGRSAWSWYSQETGDADLQRRYVDFAAGLGWEYVLVDAGWDQWSGGDADVLGVIDHAAAAGVGIHLWYNSGGPHNVIASETPRDLMHIAEVRRAELARIASWGVRGIKVDFFQSEKQLHNALYLDILEDAARERLLVNFHGCTLPRGWARTYPNLMTMEGVRGAEFYKFFDGPAAIDNVRLALTRNVVGSMDYTPVTFRDALDRRGITYAHQVALAVVFESGIQHFADRADGDPEFGFTAAFAEAPFLREFFAEVPAVWDESRLLAGSPDSHVVVARRDGARWYVAALNGTEEPLSLEIPLPTTGAVRPRVIRSGSESDEVVLQEHAPSASLQVDLAARDGTVVLLW